MAKKDQTENKVDEFLKLGEDYIKLAEAAFDLAVEYLTLAALPEEKSGTRH